MTSSGRTSFEKFNARVGEIYQLKSKSLHFYLLRIIIGFKEEYVHMKLRRKKELETHTCHWKVESVAVTRREASDTKKAMRRYI